MNILLVGDYPADPRLGSARVYYKLGDALRARGHRCEILLAPELGSWPAHPRVRWALGPWVAARAVVRASRTNGPFDVIDVASAEGLGVAAARAAGRLGRAAIVSRTHGLEHRNYARMLEDAAHGLGRKPWTRRWWYPASRMSQVAAAARAADLMVIPSPGDADFVADRGWKSRDRIRVVPHGAADHPPAPPAAGERGGLLFCGSWDPVKGVPYLVEAFTALRRRRDARLTVLGPGPPAEEVLSAFPDDVRQSVSVLDRAPEAVVRRVYREHAALVHPSTFEGFGMAVVEAMGEGCPVIATPVGCVPGFVRDGVNGWIVPPRDATGLASAMEAALADPERARRMGVRAWEAVRDLTWDATAALTEAAYLDAIRSRGKR